MNSIRNLISAGHPIRSKFLFLAVALVLIVSLGVAQVQAQGTTITSNFQQPINLSVSVQCAAGGAGEVVQLTGTEHILLVTTIDGSGGFHSKFHFQTQGITGTGQTTGARYQGSAVTQGTLNGKVGVESSAMRNFRVIGQGSASNFLINQNFHMTVHPDGTITGYVDNFSARCDSVSYP